jgi:hypothetical protein
MKKEKENYLVYKVVNNQTQEVYIGATTKSIEERKIDHQRKSKNGLGSYFQEALGTYGFDAFNWEHVDTASNINELAEKEAEYILKYNSFEAGYNSNKGSGGFKKKVYQYSVGTGELLNSYDDLTSAANAVSATKKSISNVCLNIDKTCKGFYWSYSCTSEFITSSDARKKEVIQYSLKGDLLAHYISVAEASRISRISKTCIARCCRGEREQSGGFLWKYS